MASINVKVISRNPDDYQRETKHDVFKARRNFNVTEDPFRHQIEYTRALNSAKLERLFAKPFVCALEGHSDGVHVLAKHPTRLSTILSGSLDGQVRVWLLSNKKCLSTIQAHNGPVNGLSVDQEDGTTFATVGQDAQLKLWALPEFVTGDLSEPLHSIPLSDVPRSISHFAGSSNFATSGEGICSWKVYRDSPLRKYDVGPNSVHSLSCNLIEPNILGGCCSDRSIVLLDLREKVPLTRVVLKMRTNKIAWNPIESYTFLAASEDYNVYTFDMRYLDAAKMVHKGSTLAVMDVDYAPTGQEFVAGSYDRSLRLYQVDRVKSRDIYHAPRMQHVMGVLWSLDNKFVLSSSDEFNLRLWKANASEKLGPLQPREKTAFEYHERLRDTYRHHPEVGRILRHRQVPKAIFNANNELRLIAASQRRKKYNRITKTKTGEKDRPDRVEAIVKVGYDKDQSKMSDDC